MGLTCMFPFFFFDDNQKNKNHDCQCLDGLLLICDGGEIFSTRHSHIAWIGGLIVELLLRRWQVLPCLCISSQDCIAAWRELNSLNKTFIMLM